jgi:putative tryptophan/tyrosine transport system substrate-binding protein
MSLLCSRRSFLPLVHAAWSTSLSIPASVSTRLPVVTTGGVAPFEEAAAGMRRVLASAGYQADFFDTNANEEAAAGLQRAIRKDSRLVITIGSSALQLMSRLQTTLGTIPVLGSMLVGAERSSQQGVPRSLVRADVSPVRMLEETLRLFPQATRVAWLSGRNSLAGAMSQRAAQLEARLIHASCAGPELLLPTLRSLQNRADILLCTPDPDLINAATIQPILKTTLELQIPAVGYSPAFVRSGGIAGIYASYEALGEQSAQLALRMLQGPMLSLEESPRQTACLLNRRILRLLGWETRVKASAEAQVI